MRQDIHIYFLRHKADVFEVFREYCTVVKNNFGHSIKALRVDNGREYIRNDMLHFPKLQGIRLETTAPYTPQQNGRSERQNRTLVEKARTMLHARNLPLRLWAEAMNTAVYVYNRTPQLNKNGQIPYEIWTGKHAKLNHVRTFGCDAYVHVPKEQRRKWDIKSKKTILVGYEKESTNYHLYNQETNKVIISRDVVFNEVEQKSLPTERETNLPLFNQSSSEEILETECISIEENENEVTGEEDRHYTDHNHQEAKSDDIVNNPSQHCLRDRTKIKRPSRYEANFAQFNEPLTFQQAVAGPDAVEWKSAIKEELVAHEKNQTWKIVPLPKDKMTVGCVWVFKVKNISNENLPRFKARICAKGFTQKEGIDYIETFAPVVRYESIRISHSN